MIYLLRHGQTDYNAEGRLQGQLESTLTPHGEAQVRAMADLLKTEIGDPEGWRILASPLKRTRQSAAIVGAALGLEVEIAPALIEVGCGAWEGELYADLRAREPEAFNAPDWFFQAPGGERFADMAGRIDPWFASLPPEAERRLIVVCHGISGTFVRRAYLGLTEAETIRQETPQDAIFRLAGGVSERLACAPVAA
ncbi:histidine phosphatase family protein [Phenylobacterium aquaticum]|uniref:histidine phosphatase family protein n=1 Tax=Phenylobacterium aquaticum TaxID=1763816 RepID=UPI001F5D419F|nr:phosphoglycerate mutase family protein [Phenylobacterium aquaticum]